MVMSLSASVRSMLLILVTGCCLSTLHAQDDQLPEAIKKELTRIETRLANIEGRIATGDPDQSKQSIKEARQLIDEFALNAELTKDDPLLQRLLKRATTLEDLVAKVVEERAEAAAKKPGKAMKKVTEGPDLNKLVESAVDMNNISSNEMSRPSLSPLACAAMAETTSKGILTHQPTRNSSHRSSPAIPRTATS